MKRKQQMAEGLKSSLLKSFLPAIALFTFISQQASAQKNSAIDSLQNVLQMASNDTNKVSCFNLLSQQFLDGSNYDKANQYADSALALADEINNKKGTSIAYHRKAMAAGARGNYDEARKNFLASLKGFEELGDKKDIAACYNGIGSNYLNQSNFPEALKYYFLALKLKEAIGDSSALPSTYNNIGIIYNRMGNYPEALKYSLTALKLREKAGDKRSIASSYNSIGNIYDNEGNANEALNYYSSSLKLFEEIGAKAGIGISHGNIGNIYFKQGNYSLALENYLISLKIAEENGAKKGIASAESQLGMTYGSMGNYAEALKHLMIALHLCEQMDYKRGIASNCINIGHNLFKQALADNAPSRENKFEGAFQNINKGLLLAKELGLKEVVRDAYGNLAELDSARGNSALALQHYRMFTLYKDSLLNEESARQTANLKIQYETEKKDKEIALLNKENDIKALQMKEQEAALFASRLEFENNQQQFLLLNKNNELQELTLVQAQINLAKTEAEARAREAELEKKKKENELLAKEAQLQKSVAGRQRILRNSIIAGVVLLLIIGVLFFNRYRISQKHKQQAERMRISSDLHDDVGSTLSSISMISAFAANKISEKNNGEAQKLVEEISASALEMGDDMNDIIWAINPHNDSFESIVNRLRNYASRMAESKNIALDFSAEENLLKENLPMDRRKNLYLICKEAVNNAVKYSGCKNLSVTFHKNKTNLHVAVADDGMGFDFNNNHDGNGLKNMTQRARDIQSQLSIHSEKNRGTKIEVALTL